MGDTPDQVAPDQTVDVAVGFDAGVLEHFFDVIGGAILDQVVLDQAIDKAHAGDAADAAAFDDIATDDGVAGERLALGIAGRCAAWVAIAGFDADGVDIADVAIFDDPMMAATDADGGFLGHEREGMGTAFDGQAGQADIAEAIGVGRDCGAAGGDFELAQAGMTIVIRADMDGETIGLDPETTGSIGKVSIVEHLLKLLVVSEHQTSLYRQQGLIPGLGLIETTKAAGNCPVWAGEGLFADEPLAGQPRHPDRGLDLLTSMPAAGGLPPGGINDFGTADHRAVISDEMEHRIGALAPMAEANGFAVDASFDDDQIAGLGPVDCGLDGGKGSVSAALVGIIASSMSLIDDPVPTVTWAGFPGGEGSAIG